MSRRANANTGYSTNNEVTLVKGGKDYFDLLESLIDGSQYLLFFQMYIFDEGTTGLRVAAALSRAASRGVKVYVLLDGYASQGLSDEFLERWRTSGVFFRWFEPLLRSKYFYFGRRLHHKVIVADGRHGLVGGINISDRYNDAPDHVAWLDWAVHLQGDAVHELHDICSRRAVHGRLSRKYKPIPLPPGVQTEKFPNCPVRIRVNDWVRGRREISRSYLEMLRNAKIEVILMSSYFMPGRDFRKQLRIAVKRGVTVKVILAGPSDVVLGKLAERYLYPWLLRNKVEIYEYQKSILHGKISVCDGLWVTVGSYNLNELSAKASVELNVDVLETSFSEKVLTNLEQIIQQDCIRISEQAKAHAGPWNRIVQLAAFELCRLILFMVTFYFKQHRINYRRSSE